MRTAQYLKWLALLCVVLACFGVSILIVGYKPISTGRVATISVLLIGAIILIVRARKTQEKER